MPNRIMMELEADGVEKHSEGILTLSAKIIVKVCAIMQWPLDCTLWQHIARSRDWGTPLTSSLCHHGRNH